MIILILLQASLTMDVVKREMLSHTINDIVNSGQNLQADASKTITWSSVDLYSNTFHDLLQEELRSNIKQVLIVLFGSSRKLNILEYFNIHAFKKKAI